MTRSATRFLAAGAVSSGMVAALHVVCAVVGALMFRLMGAGEQMPQLHLAGHWYPTVVTLGVAAVLAGWSLYALSGAGVIRRLPLLRTALAVITGIYLVRGVAVVPAMAWFPGNSTTFWVVSSSVCLLIGITHFIGLRRAWGSLSGKA